MMRGTFANIRLRNQLAPGTEGGWTTLLPSDEVTDDLRRVGDVPGRRRAADGHRRQGVRVGFVARLGGEGHAAARRQGGARGELRAHPPQQPGQHGRAAAGVQGRAERRRRSSSPAASASTSSAWRGCSRRAARCAFASRRRTARVSEFTATARIDTPEELVAYRNGGILPYVLRQLVQ